MSARTTALSKQQRPAPLQKAAVALLPALLLVGCGSLPDRDGFFSSNDGAPRHNIDIAAIPAAEPRIEKRSQYGNPDSYVVNGRRYHVMKNSTAFKQQGLASWYGTKFHGRKTSSGEPYDMFAMTAAHKSLPLPTWVEVINNDNNKRLIVKVNDRGPFVAGRILDLSYAAATKLGIVATGTANVTIHAIDPAQYLARKNHKQPKNTVAKTMATTSPTQPPAAITTPQATLKPAVITLLPASRPPDATSKAPAAANLITTNSQSVANSGFYLQVAAFNELGNAQQLQQRLLALEPGTVQIASGQQSGNPLFRVRIGPLASLSEAGKIAAQLTSLGLGEPKIMLD